MEQNKQTLLADEAIREKITLRAYELYQDRGGQHGRDIDDWLQAETEVLSTAEQDKRSARRQPSTTQSLELAVSAPGTQGKAAAR
jgi:hypothetical protein